MEVARAKERLWLHTASDFTASSKYVKDVFKQQIKKESDLVQMDRVLYEWCTAMHSEG